MRNARSSRSCATRSADARSHRPAVKADQTQAHQCKLLKMGRIIAVANQKGGVGKTTTAINLGASLALAERRVLLVDVDPQANLTSGVGMRDQVDANHSIYAALTAVDLDADLGPLIRPTAVDRLAIIPADRNLTGAEIEMVAAARARTAPAPPAPARSPTGSTTSSSTRPPSLGLLTLNALVAADSVLIPLHCEYFALEGLADLVATLRRVRAVAQPRARHRGRPADDVRRAHEPGPAGGARRPAVLQGKDVRHGHPAQRPARRSAEPRPARGRSTTRSRAGRRRISRSPASCSRATRARRGTPRAPAPGTRTSRREARP